MAAGDAPLRWESGEDARWRVAIPGRGCSTPVIWGDRIFLTTAVKSAGAEEREQPVARRRRSFHGGGGPLVDHSFDVICLERASGETLWTKTAITATPHEGCHGKYGSFASNSPVTDGKRVYVSFGSRGVYCYDFEGQLVWKRDFDVRMRMRVEFGEGTAPVLHNDVLLVNFDHEGQSFLAALDTSDGHVLWRTERDESTSWAAPLVLKHDGRWQVVVSASEKVRCYALADGEQIWECAGLGSNVIPQPVRAGDAVIVMSGHRQPRVMAIRLGETGNLTDSDAVVWSARRGTSYTPAPVLHENLLYTLSDRGQLSCFDATTGDTHYLSERLPRGYQFKASPIGGKNRLYAVAEAGEVVVMKMGKEFEVIATNPVADELFIASPVLVDGELFLRSMKHLYCFAQRDQ